MYTVQGEVSQIRVPNGMTTRHAARVICERTEGVHLLVIDLFPPSERDPRGIHKAIWDEFLEKEFKLLADKPLVLAAYDASPRPVALRRAGRGGRFAARDADFPETRFLRPGAVESHVMNQTGVVFHPR